MILQIFGGIFSPLFVYLFIYCRHYYSFLTKRFSRSPNRKRILFNQCYKLLLSRNYVHAEQSLFRVLFTYSSFNNNSFRSDRKFQHPSNIIHNLVQKGKFRCWVGSRYMKPIMDSYRWLIIILLAIPLW